MSLVILGRLELQVAVLAAAFDLVSQLWFSQALRSSSWFGQARVAARHWTAVSLGVCQCILKSPPLLTLLAIAPLYLPHGKYLGA